MKAAEVWALQARAMDEDTELLPKVMDLARPLGWSLQFHDYTPLRNGRGFLDLLMLHPAGWCMAAELKSHTGRLRPDQAKWMDAWLAVAARSPRVLVRLWRPMDLLDGTVARELNVGR